MVSLAFGTERQGCVYRAEGCLKRGCGSDVITAAASMVGRDVVQELNAG